MKKVVSLLVSIALLVTMVSTLAVVSKADTTSVTYTMDEGSRMQSADAGWATPSSTFGAVKYMQVDDNWVLRLPAKGDSAFGFRLPSDWASAAGEGFTPVSISIKMARGASLSSMHFVDAYFSTEVGGGNSAKGNKYLWNSAAKYPGAYPTFSTYTIDLSQVTEGTLSDYTYLTFKPKNSTGAADDAGIYIDDVTINYEGEAVPVDPYENIAIATDAEAQLRIGASNGIRFLTTVDAEKVAAAKANGYTVTMGTLIAPLSAGELTTATTPVLNVTTDGYFKNEAGTIAGSIVAIKAINIAKDFVARGYVTLTKGGDSTTYYATQPATGRSLKTLASAAMADTTFFNQLNDDQQALVFNWANA